MAIIYTYPDATPKATDKLIGTVTEDVNAVNVVKGNPTRSFTLSAVQSLFNQDVVNVVVPVTATVWKTLTNAEPITLLAAPGAGKAYDIQGVIIYVDGGTTPFNTSADPYVTGPWPTEINPVPRATVFNVTSTEVLWKYSIHQGNYIMQQNAPLQVTANSSTTTTGNGMLYFNITYKIVNTTASMV